MRQNIGLSLKKLLAKKWASLASDDAYVRKNKAAQYAIGKGYEAELVWQTLADLDTQ